MPTSTPTFPSSSSSSSSTIQYLPVASGSGSGSRAPVQPDASSHAASGSSGGSRSTRRKTGCLTCRLRKKRCDEAKPACHLCVRLGLDCLGYGAKRPRWMKEERSVKEVTAAMSNTIYQAKSQNMRSFWANKASQTGNDNKPDPTDGLPTSQATTGSNGPALDDTLSQLCGELLHMPAIPPLPHHSAPSPFTRSIASQPITQSLQSTMANTTNTVQAIPSVPYTTTDPSLALQGSATTVSPTIDADVDRYIRAFFNLSPPPPTSQLPIQPSPVPLPLYPLIAPSSAFICQPLQLSQLDMSYLRHYLDIVIPLQYRFENSSICERVLPLAFKDPDVLRSLCALAALHMASSRRKGQPLLLIQPFAPEDPDLTFAKSAIRTTMERLKKMPLYSMSSEASAVAAMCTASYYLFDGGNVKGWRETAELVRRCLAGLLGDAYSANGAFSPLHLVALNDRLGHMLSPLIWTDILISVTEGKASKWLFVYRILLLNDKPTDIRTSTLLKETVMGCDSTTRLALAEVIALSDWKESAMKMGRLSYRDLLERANGIERLLGERRLREHHLFASNDDLTVQRRSISDVFFHGVRVLLSVVVNGSYPGVPETSSAVQDTANALLALDVIPAFAHSSTRADRALVMPIVIAGCHTDQPHLQQLFRERFQHLGEDGKTFGNTSNALRLMETVWARRARVSGPDVEVKWREVMMDMGEEGLLLI